MRATKEDQSASLMHGFDELQRYAERHNYTLLGGCHICRVIKNTRHGRKDTVCSVVRACKRNKVGKRVLGYLVGLKEIEFKPDACKYIVVDL